jgi:ATP-dependent DNA helicase RecG
MAASGSPAQLLETDDNRLSCVIRLARHPLYLALAVGGGEVTGEVTGEVSGEVTGEVTDQVTTEIARLLAAAAQGEHTRNALQEALGLKHTPHFRQAFLLPALEAGLIEMTLPDKPRSSKQRYRLTPQGQRWLDTHPDGAR